MKCAVFCLLLASLLAATPTRAAPIVTDQGTKSIIFHAQGLSGLALGGYGGGIGLRYFVSDGLAIRPGLHFAYGTLAAEEEGEVGEYESRQWRLGLSFVLERHLSGSRNMSPYVGAGAGFSYARSTNEPYETPGRPTEITTRSHSTRFFTLIGFEWGITESLTLGGETQFGLYLLKYKHENDYEETDWPDDMSAWGLGFGTTALLLSVRW